MVKLKERYQRNLSIGNYPEARYELWQLSKSDALFKEADDKVTALHFYIRKKDYPKAEANIRWLHRLMRDMRDYRGDEQQQHKQAMEEPQAIISEIDKNSREGNYQKCIDLIDKFFSLKWKYPILEDRKFNYCLKIKLDTLKALIANEDFKKAKELIGELAKEKKIGEYPEEKKKLEELKHDCFSKDAKIRSNQACALFEARELEKACICAKALCSEYSTNIDALLGVLEYKEVPNAIESYMDKIERAKKLDANRDFAGALQCIEGEVPEPLTKIYGSNLNPYGSWVQELTRKAKEKDKQEQQIKVSLAKYEVFAADKLFRPAYRAIKNARRLLSEAMRTNLFALSDLNGRIKMVGAKVKAARRRLVWSYLTGEFLVLWVRRKLKLDTFSTSGGQTVAKRKSKRIKLIVVPIVLAILAGGYLWVKEKTYLSHGAAQPQKPLGEKALADKEKHMQIANLLLQARALKDSGQFDGALACVSQVLTTDARNSKAKQLKPELEMLIEQRRIHTENQKSFMAYLKAASAYEVRGEFDKAREAYTNALAIKPDNKEVQDKLAICQRKDEYGKLLKQAQNAEKENNLSESLGFYIEAQEYTKESLKEKIDLLNKQIAEKEKKAKFAVLLDRARTQKGKEALALLDQALQIYPDNAEALSLKNKIESTQDKTSDVNIPRLLYAQASDYVIVTVNGKSITEAEVDARIKTYLDKATDQMTLDMAGQYEKRIRGQVIDGMIVERLLDEQVKQANITITDNDVSNKINDMLAQQGISIDALKSMLQVQRQSFQQFRQQMKKGLGYEKLMERQGVAVDINDAEVLAYYNGNKGDYNATEQVHASHILIKVASSATAEEKVQAKKKAEKLLKQIDEGGDFAAIAKENSDCPSKAKGGDLGFFGRGTMVKPFENAAFAMRPGQVSDIVETQFGYHIIKVTDRRQAGSTSFENVKSDIVKMLQDSKKKRLFAQYIDKLRAEAKIVYPPGKTIYSNEIPIKATGVIDRIVGASVFTDAPAGKGGSETTAHSPNSIATKKHATVEVIAVPPPKTIEPNTSEGTYIASNDEGARSTMSGRDKPDLKKIQSEIDGLLKEGRFNEAMKKIRSDLIPAYENQGELCLWKDVEEYILSYGKNYPGLMAAGALQFGDLQKTITKRTEEQAVWHETWEKLQAIGDNTNPEIVGKKLQILYSYIGDNYLSFFRPIAEKRQAELRDQLAILRAKGK